MTEPDAPTGGQHRHRGEPERGLEDTVEFTLEPEDDTNAAEVAVYRVLWLLGTGMNLAWCLRDLAQPDAVAHALAQRLIMPPEDELIAYQLTDAGRVSLLLWYRAIRDRRDEPGYREIWQQVTRR